MFRLCLTGHSGSPYCRVDGRSKNERGATVVPLFTCRKGVPQPTRPSAVLVFADLMLAGKCGEAQRQQAFWWRCC
eukprot:3807818-Amphidinium_carterae.2